MPVYYIFKEPKMVLNLFRNENISIFMIGWEINLSNSTTDVNLPPIFRQNEVKKIQTYKLYTWSFPTASFVPPPPFSWKYKPSLPFLLIFPWFNGQQVNGQHGRRYTINLKLYMEQHGKKKKTWKKKKNMEGTEESARVQDLLDTSVS